MAVDPNLIAEFLDRNGNVVVRLLRDGNSPSKVVMQPQLPTGGQPHPFAKVVFYRAPRGTVEFTGRFVDAQLVYLAPDHSIDVDFSNRSFLSESRDDHRGFSCAFALPLDLHQFFGAAGVNIPQLALRNDTPPGTGGDFANWTRENLWSSTLNTVEVAHSISARDRDSRTNRPAGGILKALLRNLKDVDFGLRESNRGANDVPQPNPNVQPNAIQYVDVGFRKITLRHSDGATYDRMVVASGTTIRAKPGKSGTFDLRLAEGAVARIPVDQDHPIRVELYQDPHSDKAEAPASPATNWYLELTGVPGHALCAIWNRWVAEPYLAALRTVVDGDDLTLMPRLSALDTPTGENAERYALLFRVKNADVDRDRWGIPDLVGIKPLDTAGRVGFHAQASYSGLIDHEGKPVEREVRVKLHPNKPGQEVWPVDRDKDNQKINVETEALAIELSKFGDADPPHKTMLRVGALDLEVPVAGDVSGMLRVRFEPLERAGFDATRLPTPHSVRPRISLEYGSFQVTDARPGGQDALPDAVRAFEAVLDDVVTTDLPNAEAERAIASNLRPEAPIVIARPDLDTPISGEFTIRGAEITRENETRSLRMNLFMTTDNAAKLGRLRTVVIDTTPVTVASVEMPAFSRSSDSGIDNDGEIGNWQVSDLEGSRWELGRITEGFDLYFPPQATGEAMEKGRLWTPISPEETNGAGDPGSVAVDYRLGEVARLRLLSSYFRQRYMEAPWNLRRVLGYAGQRAPGAGLVSARFELMYGLSARASSVGLRLAELESRVGALRDPLPARPLGLDRSNINDPQTQSTAEVYDKFRLRWSTHAKAWHTRLGVFEAWREGATGSVVIEDNLAFQFRVPVPSMIDPDADLKLADVPREPWKSEVDLPPAARGLAGGATRGFESKNIYEEVIAKPTSDRGRIVDPSFSALGGSGSMRVLFAKGKSRIEIESRFGRVHSYSVERIGRIGVFWNVAKHVIVYRRTTLPSEQFYEYDLGNPGQPRPGSQPLHLGRPVLRKVEEYIELIQPLRRYPEKGQAPATRGFVEACVFRQQRIPVNASWGRDIPDGWAIPLWNPADNQTIYPKPEPVIHLTAAGQASAPVIEGRFKRPDQLVFYTSTRAVDTDDTDAWAPFAGIDLVNVKSPESRGTPTLNSADPDGMVADDLMRDPLYDPCTFDVDTGGQKADLMSARNTGEQIGSVLETVTMMRALPPATAPTGVQVGQLASAFDLRQDLETAIRDADQLKSRALDLVGSVTRAVGSAALFVSKERALEEIGRLSEFKTLLLDQTGRIRARISNLTQWSGQVLPKIGTGWASAGDEVLKRLKAEIQQGLKNRLTQADELFVNVKAEIQNRREEWRNLLPGSVADRVIALLEPLQRLASGGAAATDLAIQRVELLADELAAAIDAARSRSRQVRIELVDEIGKLKGSASGAAGEIAIIRNAAGRYHSEASSAIDRIEDIVKRKAPNKLRGTAEIAAARQIIDDAYALAKKTLDDAGNDVDKAKEAFGKFAGALTGDVGSFSAKIEDALAELSALVGQARTEAEAVRASIGKFTTGLDEKQKALRTAIEEQVRKAANFDAAFNAALKSVDDARQAVIGIAKDVDAIAGGAAQVVETLLNDLKDAINTTGDVTQAAKNVQSLIDKAVAEADATITTIEQAGVRAIDLAVATLQDAVNGNWGQIADAAKQVETELKAIEQQFRTSNIGGRLADAARTLERGYSQLASAPTFQNPAETLRLLRAAGESPILPNLKFNRERIAYFFDDAKQAVQTSPVVALLNRANQDLQALGIRVPTNELLDRIKPKGLDQIDFGKVLPDLSGLKLDNLFKGFRLPPIANDRVKVTHGFDKSSLTAWAKVRAGTELDPRTDVFAFGPLKLAVLGGRFDALVDFMVDITGKPKKTVRAELAGNWELAFGGLALVTFADTKVTYEDGRGLDYDLDPRRVQFDRAIQFLSDLVKSYSEPGSGFFLEMLKTPGGLPAGIAARLDLPMPPLAAGAFSVSGLRFGAGFELVLMPKGEDGRTKSDFAVGISVSLGRKIEPFNLLIAFLTGGGWLEARARYFPSSGQVVSDVVIGMVAGVGVDFSLGVIRGFVYVQFGVFVEFHSGQGSSLTIGVMLLLRGGVVILGRFSIGLQMLLQVTYSSDGAVVGTGTLSLTFKICWCLEIEVRQDVRYVLKKGSSSGGSAPARSSMFA
jgi:hypothetical protein